MISFGRFIQYVYFHLTPLSHVTYGEHSPRALRRTTQDAVRRAVRSIASVTADSSVIRRSRLAEPRPTQGMAGLHAMPE